MIANGEEIPIEVYSGDLQADIVEPAIVSVAPSTVKRVRISPLQELILIWWKRLFLEVKKS